MGVRGQLEPGHSIREGFILTGNKAEGIGSWREWLYGQPLSSVLDVHTSLV